MADDAPLLIHSLEEEAEDSLILISPFTEPSLEQRLPDGGLPAPPLQLLRDLSLPPVSAVGPPLDSLQALMCFS